MESIYAVDSNNGLSKDNSIPWKCKKDMKFFVDKTKNNVVIMGKNTYFSLPKNVRPLKERLNIVLTSNPQDIIKQINSHEREVIFTNDENIYKTILSNKDNYLDKYKYLKNDFKIIFIGGKTIYNTFIPLCEKVWVSKIKKDYKCDLFFEYDYLNEFKIREIIYDDEELTISLYERKNKV
jgi:dihydrofolate reductase